MKSAKMAVEASWYDFSKEWCIRMDENIVTMNQNEWVETKDKR